LLTCNPEPIQLLALEFELHELAVLFTHHDRLALVKDRDLGGYFWCDSAANSAAYRRQSPPSDNDGEGDGEGRQQKKVALPSGAG
jgi:hypothetical protein